MSSQGGVQTTALATMERLNELALESGLLGSWQLTVATGEAMRSLRHDQIFGYNHGAPDWTYERFLSHVHPDQQGSIDATYRKALEEKTAWEFETRIVRTDDEERWIWAKGRHFHDEAGNAVEIIGLVGDITERKVIELAFLQNEKLAAVGRLASTIAHEINNPLEAVTNLLYLAQHSGTLDEVQGYLRTAELELNRVSVITAQTLRFHKEALNPTEVHWADLAQSVLTVFHGRLGTPGIELHADLAPGPPFCCYAGEIRQVLNNLVSNALDALRGCGRLVLRSHPVWFGPDDETFSAFTVADTGEGMPPEVLQRIFQAFFTTKGDVGVGLGLAVSREILQRHHGRLLVRSRTGQQHGTVFTVVLPVGRRPDPPFPSIRL